MNQTYTVKAGDTLYGISNQFGVSVTELASLNNVNANNLKIGMILKIPIKSGTNPDTMFMYTVKAGDSLYAIAKKYNTTVDEIKKLNYLETNTLAVGQILRIPEMYTPEEEFYLPNYINYSVKKGDTIYSIANNFNVPINTIIKDNSLTSNTLKIGQTIKIRVFEKENVEVEEECFGEDYTPKEDTNNISYIVKSGDNLYSIAKKFNTTTSEIVNINNLKNNNLSIGQILKIPTNNIYYTVKKGDSLYSIAKKFNKTVNEIKSKNNLNSNLLSIGQKLII